MKSSSSYPIILILILCDSTVDSVTLGDYKNMSGHSFILFAIESVSLPSMMASNGELLLSQTPVVWTKFCVQNTLLECIPIYKEDICHTS